MLADFNDHNLYINVHFYFSGLELFQVILCFSPQQLFSCSERDGGRESGPAKAQRKVLGTDRKQE